MNRLWVIAWWTCTACAVLTLAAWGLTVSRFVVREAFGGWIVAVGAGGVWISHDAAAGGASLVLRRGDAPVLIADANFHYWWFDYGKGNLRLRVPLWSIALVFGGGALATFRLGRRTTSHACRACGYSLAGLRHGAPCPECGNSGSARS